MKLKLKAFAAALVVCGSLIQSVEAGGNRDRQGQLRSAHPITPKASSHGQMGRLRSGPVARASPKVGALKTLVVLIKTTDGQPTYSREVTSDKVFGTNGDQVNLKTQYPACSHGKLQIAMGTGPDVVNGVTEVSVNMKASGTESKDLGEAAEEILNSRFGTTDLEEQFDQIMFVCPSGSLWSSRGADWSGWADSEHRSYFLDEYIIRPTLQLHEIGHNLWLDHSNELDQTYMDATGIMGASSNHDEGDKARVCFNPAKSWQLGWYSDKSVVLNPQQNGESIETLVGVNNYGKITGTEKVLLKIAGPAPQDFYIGFNHADGMNSGTAEAANMVTVVTQEIPDNDDWEGSLYSSLVAKLYPGKSYTTSTGVVIKVLDIDSTPSTGFAKVQICVTGSCTEIPSARCENYANWKDEEGASCSEWENNDWCEYAEDYFDVSSDVSAAQGCCICGGGSIIPLGPLPTPPPTKAPTSPPTQAPIAAADCQDMSEWVDQEGDACSDWTESPDWCENSDSYWDSSSGYTAGQACCVCGGGSTNLNDWTNPGNCANLAGWVDADEAPCLVWEKNRDWCDDYGNEYPGTDGKTPNQACCVCGGGLVA